MIFLSPKVVDKTKFWKKQFSGVLSHELNCEKIKRTN